VHIVHDLFLFKNLDIDFPSLKTRYGKFRYYRGGAIISAALPVKREV